jgi:hypothetical protein
MDINKHTATEPHTVAEWLGDSRPYSISSQTSSFLAKLESRNAIMSNALLSRYARSDYAYIISAGAELAKRLGYQAISVLELGVAGGRGLVAMEKLARAVEEEFGILIHVYGFDTGVGMPEYKDSRDMPHFFKQGNYQMNEGALQSALKNTQLVLGDVEQTFPAFLEGDIAPIAAISFDMDYYYPTIAALNAMALDKHANKHLPRIFAYFDNTVGDHIKAYNDYAGERLAIRNFNDSHTTEKLVPNAHFLNLPFNMPWHHKIHILHLFSHPAYNTYIGDHSPNTLQLKKRKKKRKDRPTPPREAKTTNAI